MARHQGLGFLLAGVPGIHCGGVVCRSESERLAAVGGPGISPEKSIVSDSLNILLYGKSPSHHGYVDTLGTMDAVYRRSAVGGQRFDEDLQTVRTRISA